MINRWAASVLVLALCALTPRDGVAQSKSPPKGGLVKNYPNPFNPETSIQFTVGDEGCSDPSKQYSVTIRIYDQLVHEVANPILQVVSGGTGTAGQAGRRVAGLKLTCGSYKAYWDGKIQRSGRVIGSGQIIALLEVDGVSVATLKMQVKK
jgi:hypothetical protein